MMMEMMIEMTFEMMVGMMIEMMEMIIYVDDADAFLSKLGLHAG